MRSFSDLKKELMCPPGGKKKKKKKKSNANLTSNQTEMSSS
jgi:hypothetical protein